MCPRTVGQCPLILPNEWAVLVCLGYVSIQVLLEEGGSVRYRLAKDIEFAIADEPVLWTSLDKLAIGQRHRTKIRELRRVTHWVCFENFAMLRAGKAVAVLVPFIFELRQPES